MPAKDPFSVSEPGALGLLSRIVREGTFLYLHADDENYSAVTYQRIGDRIRRVTAVHPTLAGLLRCLDAGGKIENDPMRKCPGCNKPRRWGEFSFDKAGPGGKRRLCKLCERTRVKKHLKDNAQSLVQKVLNEPGEARRN